VGGIEVHAKRFERGPDKGAERGIDEIYDQ
jgi:hypothetical protein